MSNDLWLWLYHPNPNLMQHQPNPAYCRYGVRQHHGWGDAQCSRKPVEELGGFGFCRQHAKRIRAILVPCGEGQ